MRSCDGCDICLGTHVKIEAAADPKPAKRATRRAEASSRATREERAPRPAISRRQRAAPAEYETPLSDDIDPGAVDVALIGALRTLRTSIAREEKLPAYCVFPDRTLVEMAARKPSSLAALATVRGVGPAKLEKYGELFLGAIRGADGANGA